MSWSIVPWKEDRWPQMVHIHPDGARYWVRVYVGNTRCSGCEQQAPEELITQWLLVHDKGKLYNADEVDMTSFKYNENSKEFIAELR